MCNARSLSTDPLDGVQLRTNEERHNSHQDWRGSPEDGESNLDLIVSGLPVKLSLANLINASLERPLPSHESEDVSRVLGHPERKRT